MAFTGGARIAFALWWMMDDGNGGDADVQSMACVVAGVVPTL